MFLLSFAPFLTFYALLELGRGYQFGYGPRYQLPIVVPLAAGAGPALAALWDAARRKVGGVRGLSTGGPAALAVAAIVLGVVRIAPLVYPYNYADVYNHNRFHHAIQTHPVSNAIVFVGNGLTNTDPLDLTENLPLDLYPDQEVIIALDRSPEVVECVKHAYPSRQFYRAVPGNQITLVPY
jgi:hypothetical protein